MRRLPWNLPSTLHRPLKKSMKGGHHANRRFIQKLRKRGWTLVATKPGGCRLVAPDPNPRGITTCSPTMDPDWGYMLSWGTVAAAFESTLGHAPYEPTETFNGTP